MRCERQRKTAENSTECCIQHSAAGGTPPPPRWRCMAPALWLFAVRALCEVAAGAGDSNPSTAAPIEDNSVVATNSAWAQISHISCVSPHDLEFGDGIRAHCHWTVRERVGREAKACTPAPAINTTEQLSLAERDVYGWTPPDLNESVLQELDEYEDPEELCAAAGLPLRRISARVLEVMLYNHEADHLLVKLLEYGDLLEKLVVVEARTDFNFEQKPLGLELVKHLPALRRWLHVLDHGQVECYDESSRGSSERSALARLHQFNLSPEDIIVVADADEILTRRAVRLIAECQVTAGHGPGRIEMEGYRYNFNCRSIYEWISVTALTWGFASSNDFQKSAS